MKNEKSAEDIAPFGGTVVLHLPVFNRPHFQFPSKIIPKKAKTRVGFCAHLVITCAQAAGG
jgi:hypothetical protein